jgi:MFS family permease
MGATTNIMRWLETVALGFFVYELTGSPFWVAFVGLLRMLPMLVLGAFVGVIADRIDRRLLLMAGTSLLAVTYAVLAALAITEHIQFWHVATGAFLAGLVWVIDFPARRSMIAEVVQPQQLATAMGLEMATSNFSRMLGPLVAGGFLATVGISGAYTAGVGLYICAFLMVATLNYRAPAVTRSTQQPLRNLIEGLRYIRSDAVVVMTLAITVAMNAFAFPYSHMVPVIADQKLGAGATLGSLLIAVRAKPEHYTRAYVFGSLLFLLAVLMFALAPWYALALVSLFVGGFGTAAFGALQSIIIITSTPPEMRGRVLGVLAVAIGTGPIGALQVGLLAVWLGAPVAVMATATAGIIVLAGAVAVYPGYMRIHRFGGVANLARQRAQLRSRRASAKM